MTARRWRSPTLDWLYGIVLLLVGGGLALTTRRRLKRRPRTLPPGPLIVVGNHVSVADPFVLATTVARLGRRPRFLGTAGLFKGPLGFLLRGAGFIPVHRRTANAADALVPALDALAAGECIALYPEGRITRHPDWWPETGKTGAARLAYSSGAPVVPVAQWGTHKLVGRKERLRLLRPRWPKISIAVGEPLTFTAEEEPSADQLRTATAEIMAALTRLLADLRGELPPAAASDAPSPG